MVFNEGDFERPSRSYRRRPSTAYCDRRADERTSSIPAPTKAKRDKCISEEYASSSNGGYREMSYGYEDDYYNDYFDVEEGYANYEVQPRRMRHQPALSCDEYTISRRNHDPRGLESAPRTDMGGPDRNTIEEKSNHNKSRRKGLSSPGAPMSEAYITEKPAVEPTLLETKPISNQETLVQAHLEKLTAKIPDRTVRNNSDQAKQDQKETSGEKRKKTSEEKRKKPAASSRSNPVKELARLEKRIAARVKALHASDTRPNARSPKGRVGK